MQNFSNQCLDLARSLLGNNLKHLNPDGTVTPAAGESPRADEPGHAALAIGEFFRASGEVELEGHDLLTYPLVVSPSRFLMKNLMRMVWLTLHLVSSHLGHRKNVMQFGKD